jgi:hypothetical protein
MRVSRGPAILALTVGVVAGGFIAARESANQTKIFEVLPRAEVSRELEELKKHLVGSVVFVDPVTGELRSPAPGEVQALAGDRTGGDPAVVELPQGGAAVRLGATNIEFLTATRVADGSVALSHSLRKSAEGGSHVR